MRPVLLILLLAMLLPPAFVFAQKPAGKIELRGIIFDQSHDSALKSVTVAVYKIKDSSLLSYRLTNSKGEFSFDDLPSGTPLKLIASCIGFSSYQHTLTLSGAANGAPTGASNGAPANSATNNATGQHMPQKPNAGQATQVATDALVVDLGRIKLHIRTSQLDSVVVSAAPPPVRMRGDTLEFNSDAFKLDRNAQVEDLVRILPGVTMWMSDGSITVNGRKISQVLVNGKPFFGSDPKVALQNLPKNIIDKIQVYQRVNEDIEKKDSTNILDIKLKKGKESGIFGKIDAGYGTSGHYESDASENYFNGRTQLGAAFTSNNINKVAGDLSMLLRNNTFKPNGMSVEYSSDFSVPGVNNFTSAGLLLQHDFIDSASWKNQNQLTGIYFFKNNQRDLEQRTQTITTINDSTIFNSNNQTSTHSTNYGHNADLRYTRSIKNTLLTLDGNYRSNTSNSISLQDNTTTDRADQFLNQQTSLSKTAEQDNNYHLSASLNRSFSKLPKWNSIYQLRYSGSFYNTQSTSLTTSSYTASDSSLNRSIDRQYHPISNSTDHNLSFHLPNFSRLFFHPKLPKSLPSAGLEGSLHTLSSRTNNDVYDRDTVTKDLVANNALSNRQHDFAYDFNPGLNISWGTNNYNPKSPPKTSRYFGGNISLIEAMHGYHSWSVQQVQNLDRTYHNFSPTVYLYYNSSRPGKNGNGGLNYSSRITYPSLQQLAPLVDNSTPTYLQFGNTALTEQVTRELDLYFSNSYQKTNGNFSWNAKAQGSYSNNYISTSSNIDSLGQTRVFPVNLRGYHRIYLSLELKKDFRSTDPKKIQVQLTALPEFSIDHSPRFINQQLSFYNNYSVVITPTLGLNYKDLVTFNLSEREGWARSTQTGQTSPPLTNHTSSTTASGFVKVTYSLSISSNITYTTNTSTASTRQAFTLWNASIIYRLFRDQSGEIKFAALDILHQNTGLINSAFDNSIVHGNSNLLQQYFMLTLAWHPRKFGFSGTKKS